MNRHVKLGLVLATLIFTTSMIAYGSKPETPNLIETVQNIYNLLQTHDVDTKQALNDLGEATEKSNTETIQAINDLSGEVNDHAEEIIDAVEALEKDVDAQTQEIIAAIGTSETEIIDAVEALEKEVEDKVTEIKQAIEELRNETDDDETLQKIQALDDKLTAIKDKIGERIVLYYGFGSAQETMTGQVPVMVSGSRARTFNIGSGGASFFHLIKFDDVANIQLTMGTHMPEDYSVLVSVRLHDGVWVDFERVHGDDEQFNSPLKRLAPHTWSFTGTGFSIQKSCRTGGEAAETEIAFAWTATIVPSN